MSSAISGHKGRDRWMCAILTRDVLPLLEVRVAIRLGIFFNCKTGQCDPGYDTLASELGISRRTLFRALARLKANGWIAIHRVGRDEYVQFSLFIPPQLVPPRGANMVAPQEVTENGVRGDTMVSPHEVPHEVTENADGGDKNRGVEVTDRLAAQKNLKPENLNSSVLRTEHTSRIERESTVIDSATVDDETPNQRAAQAAPIEPVTAQQPTPSRVNPIGAGPNGAGSAPTFREITAGFEQVRRDYPEDRIDDYGIEFGAYCRALVAFEDRIDAVAEAIITLKLERGANLPDLADALAIIIERSNGASP